MMIFWENCCWDDFLSYCWSDQPSQIPYGSVRAGPVKSRTGLVWAGPVKSHTGSKRDMSGFKRTWYGLALSCPLKSQCKPTELHKSMCQGLTWARYIWDHCHQIFLLQGCLLYTYRGCVLIPRATTDFSMLKSRTQDKLTCSKVGHFSQNYLKSRTLNGGF